MIHEMILIRLGTEFRRLEKNITHTMDITQQRNTHNLCVDILPGS